MVTLTDPPAKVLQDDFSPAKGNALQACVASIFAQPLSDVPNFIELECGYEKGIQSYISPKYVCMKKHLCDIDDSNSQNKVCILRGKSPRGNFGHVVVARYQKGGTFDMLHDPHPDATFLDTSEAFGWCMFFEEVQ